MYSSSLFLFLLLFFLSHLLSVIRLSRLLLSFFLSFKVQTLKTQTLSHPPSPLSVFFSTSLYFPFLILSLYLLFHFILFLSSSPCSLLLFLSFLLFFSFSFLVLYSPLSLSFLSPTVNHPKPNPSYLLTKN
ncbi:hypothetical protein RchiOBHm_Chr4g0444211 [Rosa chinensis]|uniref:Uncharacterized protein n=1 Tax=Rosa chinensis TaxID=74649 RepID=A0A2P6R425_ROSCH|nr:hypothetical protein RchiOBHm_Chr4g0444211 [Rosa chinensis]